MVLHILPINYYFANVVATGKAIFESIHRGLSNVLNKSAIAENAA